MSTKTPANYTDGEKYVLDAEFNNGSIVTLVSHGNIYGKVKGDESEWETMLNRLTEIPEWAKPFLASHQPQHHAVGQGYESEFEKLFKPYCIDYLSKEPESERKIKVDFAFNNKDEAFKLLQSCYHTDYGSIDIDENLVSIHTGGWSDNEEIISEFKKTFWWQTNFRMQITVGHYYFDTDRQDGKKEWDITKTSSTPLPNGATIEKIKEYLFNTANAGENINADYLKQTIEFLQSLSGGNEGEAVSEDKIFDIINKTTDLPVTSCMVVQNKIMEYLQSLPPQASVPTSIQCKCTPDQKHGETSVMCCNDCGLPCEPFWDVVPPLPTPPTV